MNILADENIEVPVVARLRAEGHQVLYIAEIASGSDDRKVLESAIQAEAVLLTEDKDFGDLVFLHHLIPPSVILVRLSDELPSSAKADIIIDVIRSYRKQLLQSFTVITLKKVRIIKLFPKDLSEGE